MNNEAFNQGLLTFLHRSPTPFHAASNMTQQLENAGFQSLQESDAWQLTPGGRYYVTRNDSSLIAFIHGRHAIAENGIRMVGAHTDSPCLKVKPNPEMQKNGYFQLGVEVYGGVLLNPWYDRDLSLAGRVTFKNKQNQLQSTLIDFADPIAVIPSLAIHLDRDVNKNRSINPQRDIPPILMQVEDNETLDFRQLLLEQLQKSQPQIEVESILDYELSFYDTQPPGLVGLRKEFIASARLDNLLSCYIGLQSLLTAGDDHSSLLICNDHEEVGSASACGAQGPMLKSFLERLIPDVETRNRTIDLSMMISADNAHGIHPNYSDRHDGNHGPLLNKGPVIKINANQRYATNSDTSAVYRYLSEQAEVPVQTFVTRTDMGCGSTIGPITATEIGVKTLDIGVPTFAMHSVRELAGVNDAYSLYQVLHGFFQQPVQIQTVRED